MRFVPHSEREQKEMLDVIGTDNPMSFFKHVPTSILLRKDLNLDPAMSELALKQHLHDIAEKNTLFKTCLLGAGAYNHFIPSVVSHITGRSEFYTSYTPYQPEASQGNLQSIFEFQTAICNLTGMEVANASMYDAASALAEGMLMANRINDKKEIVVSSTIHPSHREVVKTYAKSFGLKIIEVGYEDGVTFLEALKTSVSDNTAAVLVQHPNFFGCLEPLDKIDEIAKKNNALFIVSIVEPTSLGLLKPAGEFGADIVVGEGQSFGIPLNCGGPYLGFMATKQEYMRKLPGRLVGRTTDSDGNTGYVLTLQAREQHIRREKATSNICTNEALCMLSALVYLAVVGKEGLKHVANLNIQHANYLHNRIQELSNFNTVFKSQFYNEFVVRCRDKPDNVNDILMKNNFLGGLDLGRYYPELKNHMLFCVTEMVSKDEIDRLIRVLEEL